MLGRRTLAIQLVSWWIIALTGASNWVAYARGVVSEPEINADAIPRRHDHKFAVKRPYYFVDNNTIPYFDVVPGTLKSEEFLRLTMSLPNHIGGIWSNQHNPHKEWIAEFTINVFGRGQLGGAGIAFWYTKERMEAGPIFGNRDQWHGLAIMFDTGSEEENRYIPYIYASLNDGTKKFEGSNDHIRESLGGCFRDYRNNPSPVHVRVAYMHRVIQVDVDLRQNGHGFSTCLHAKDIDLPTGYYFGVTGSTLGHRFDDQDLLSFEVWEFNPKPKKGKTSGIAAEDTLDTEAKSRIEATEHLVEEILLKQHVIPDEEPETINPHAISKLQESQFKIIESLNILVDRFAEASASSGSKPGDVHVPASIDALEKEFKTFSAEVSSDLRKLDDRLGLLINDVHELAAAVRDMVHAAGGKQETLVQRIENHLSTLGRKVDDVDAKASQTLAEQANAPKFLTEPKHNWTFYTVFFFAGLVVMYVGFTIYRLRENSAPKKFI
ncbi:concanavalin A-like lectin/glucanase domain-containing protein [Cladochytrium replicatum]|nr:concanavalin A-like lectin/glucanase domain-containing protein [Cladochytrium replicatum]